MIIIEGFNYFRKKLDWFIPEENRLNNILYNYMLKQEDVNGFDVDAEDVFNDAYMICIKAINDKHPENNFVNKFTPPSVSDDSYYYNLVWIIVYFLMMYQEKRHFQNSIHRFLIKCDHYLRHMDYYSDLQDEFDSFIADEDIEIEKTDRICENHGFEVNYDDINPVIKYDFTLSKPIEASLILPSKWQKWTNNFRQEYIDEIINCYDNKKSALDAINIIEMAWKNCQENTVHVAF